MKVKDSYSLEKGHVHLVRGLGFIPVNSRLAHVNHELDVWFQAHT